MNENSTMPKRRLRIYFGVSAWLAASAIAFSPAAALSQLQGVDAVVAKAEGGIACILVSRSDWYRKLGAVKGDEPAGKLGGFDFNIFKNMLPVPSDGSRDAIEMQQHFRIKLDLAYPQHAPESYGSGLVVDRLGLVLTNYHVVQDATKVFVRLPGGKGSYADIWAADPRSDLAVLKLLDERIGALTTTIPMGNADGLRRGEPVIAMANPFAAGIHDGQPSVSTGVVSNLRRRVPGQQPVKEASANPLYRYGVLIQTDARIALGCSGGALLNLQGECVGITTSLAAIAGSDAPGGFAMPINSAIGKIIEVLKRGEEVDYGFLGIQIETESAPQGGAVVAKPQKGSPAIRGGLKSGDVIVAVGQHTVRDSHDLMLGLGLYFAGEKAPITFLRNGLRENREIELVKYNVLGKKIASTHGNRPLVDGLRVDYTSLLVQIPNNAKEIPMGVLVVDVQPNSKAARANLLKDDIITHVDGNPVVKPTAFYEQVSRRAGPFDLKVRRGISNQEQKVRW